MKRSSSYILLAVASLSLCATWMPSLACAQETVSGPPLAEFYRPIYEPPVYGMVVPAVPAVTVISSDCRRCSRRAPVQVVGPVFQPAYIAPQVPVVPMMPGSPTMSAFYVPTGPVAIGMPAVGVVPARRAYRWHTTAYPSVVQPVIYPVYWYPG